MARQLLIIFLILSSEPVYAEWVSVSANNPGETMYVDPGTIRRTGDMVTMWALYDFGTIQSVWSISFMSRESQREYDCIGKRTRRITLTYFSGAMGSGTVVYSDADEQKWKPIQPQSVAQLLWKIACSK